MNPYRTISRGPEKEPELEKPFLQSQQFVAVLIFGGFVLFTGLTIMASRTIGMGAALVGATCIASMYVFIELLVDLAVN